MSRIATIAAAVFRKAGKDRRIVVGVAGPPASGKSTLAAELRDLLPAGEAIVVPMDGFHYDDAVLERKGLRHVKGAPETFDFAGFEWLLRRIQAGEPEIAIPIFDRSMELSRAAADIVGTRHRFVIVEGNYLLLDEAPWSRLAPLFGHSVFLDVPRGELERRLRQRWRGHGRPDAEALAWIASNDMPNVERVLARRRPADAVISDA